MSEISLPQFFSDLPYVNALALANSRGCRMLVHVTASGDIRTNPAIDAKRESEVRAKLDEVADQVTWAAPELATALSGRLVAVRVGANSEAAKLLNVTKGPSVVVLDHGEEIDRIEMMWPPWTPARIVRWLDGLSHGTKAAEQQRETAEEVRTRFRRGKELHEQGSFAEAAKEFLWLWQYAVDVVPTWGGVRHVHLLEAARRLVEADPGARSEFEGLRDAAEASLDRVEGIEESIRLNRILGQQGSVVSWLEALPQEAGLALGLDRSYVVLEVVRAENAWRVFGSFISDPVGLLRQEHQMQASLLSGLSSGGQGPEMQAMGIEGLAGEHFRSLASTVCRSLAACGRQSDASVAITEARRLDPSPEMEAALAGGGADQVEPARRVQKSRRAEGSKGTKKEKKK